MERYQLTEVVETYCFHTYNDKKKHFARHLAMARLVWQDLLLRTIWANEFTWVELRTGDPYPFIEVPPGAFLGLYTLDAQGQLVAIRQNNRINILPKPARKSCGCAQSCDCGNLCSGLAALGFTSQDVVIDGVTYQDRTWLQVCSTGELRQWREAPTKVYAADGTYTIGTTKNFSALCTLKVRPCGCVEESVENQELVRTYCGIFPVSNCVSVSEVIPEEQYKFSDCGTKIEITGARSTWYGVHRQRVGAADHSPVPFYCLDAMMAGISERSTRFNPTRTAPEKEYARAQYREERKKVLQFLNPIRLDVVEHIGGERKTW